MMTNMRENRLTTKCTDKVCTSRSKLVSAILASLIMGRRTDKVVLSIEMETYSKGYSKTDRRSKVRLFHLKEFALRVDTRTMSS